jgi:hypothetical protein
MSKLGNEPAYPSNVWEYKNKEEAGKGGVMVPYRVPGMTIRQYFVAQAMKGLVAENWNNFENLAKLAVKCADSCLAEEERTKNE